MHEVYVTDEQEDQGAYFTGSVTVNNDELHDDEIDDRPRRKMIRTPAKERAKSVHVRSGKMECEFETVVRRNQKLVRNRMLTLKTKLSKV